MTKLRVDWHKIVRNSLAAAGISAGISVCAGFIGLLALIVDADNGNANIREAVEDASTMTPETGRVVTLVDFNTVQIRQGTMAQTFSFALDRVFTTANFGNGHAVDESAPFDEFSNKSAINQARTEGCLIAGNMKHAMENYDFGIRTGGRESRTHKEHLETANLYLRKHCPGSAP